MFPTGRPSFLLVALCLYGSLLIIHALSKVWISEKTAKKTEGSWVTINCSYKHVYPVSTQLWIKDAVYNTSSKNFDGIIIYSNTEARPQNPEYWNRVQFLNTHNNENKNEYSCTVRINNLRLKDSGNYSFRFISDHIRKQISEPLFLEVHENKCKVTIMPLELNNTVKEGDTVTLHCSTSADCSFDPEWYDPGSVKRSKLTREIISVKERGEKSSVLMLKVSWEDDGRTLACRTVESEDECLVKTVTLSVKYGPKEVKVMEKLNYEMKEGQHLMVNCSSKAHPNATFQWFNHNLNGYYQIGNALSWNKLKPENSGVYYCQASNPHGMKNSDNITINVIYPPRNVTVIAKFPIIKKGDRLELTCLVEDSNPAVPDSSYIWYKDVNVINNEKTKTLIIPTISRDDKGLYSCKAENAAGMKHSVPANISVKFAPENTLIQGVTKIMFDLTLHLSCQTEADPHATSYSWYFKAKHARQYVQIFQADQVYQIVRVTTLDAGLYTCSARNNIGTGANSSEFSVLVLYGPNITITYNITSLTEWDEDVPVYLSCSVDCEPPATSYAWYRLEDNATVLSTDQNYTVQPQKPGTYYCYAENAVGISKSDPVKLYTTRLVPRWLLWLLTPVFFICLGIAVIYLLYSGLSMFMQAPCGNMRENIVIKGTREHRNFNDPAAIAHPSATAIQAGSFCQISNISTVYDVIKQKEEIEEDLCKTQTNSSHLKSTDDSTTKSASNIAGPHSVYAVISKQKKKGLDGDYENLSMFCHPNVLFSNTDRDSDNSEEGEEVNYSHVSFIMTSKHKPRKQNRSSDEEETEYSQIKV